MYNRKFKSSEAAYQYAMASEHNDKPRAEEISRAPTALRAKQISNEIEQSEEWKNKKSDVMWDVLEEKARQCANFRNRLIDTGDHTLIENTEDDYWGRGKDGNGKNMLGTLLMLLRQKLLLDGLPTRQHQTYPRNPERQRRCTNCGEHNHVRQDCGFRKEIKCYRCNKYGHKQKFCGQYSEW